MRTSSHSPAIGSGTVAASVMRAPLIVTPPPAISRRASPFDARSPASASSVALPAASHAGWNVNPPADAYRAARTAGSSIGSAENLAAESATARAAASAPWVRVVMSSARACWPARASGCASSSASSASIASRGSSVNQRR